MPRLLIRRAAQQTRRPDATKDTIMKRTTALVATLSALAFGALVLTPAPVLSQGMGPDMPAFADLDKDGDGQINRADLTAFAADRFAAADTDGNGSLSAQALARATTRAERMSTRMINMMDTDGDGELSADEMQRMGRRGGGDMGAWMLARADTDGDGAVSEAEYDAAMEKMAERGHRRGGAGHGKGHDGHRDRG